MMSLFFHVPNIYYMYQNPFGSYLRDQVDDQIHEIRDQIHTMSES